MNIKRVALLAFLTSSLLLTSCDFLAPLNNKNGSVQEGTKVSKEEWNNAFSLRDTVFNRNVKITYFADYKQGLYVEHDNGKVKMTYTYDGVDEEDEIRYFNFKSVNNNQATLDYYYFEEGVWTVEENVEQFDYCLTQFGLLAYDYDNFTYDYTKHVYRSESYTYEIKGEELEYAFKLSITDCVISLTNGLPKQIDFDFVNEGSTDDYTYEKRHFTAVYTDYDKVNVELPSEQQSEFVFPKPKGQQITFSEFERAFNNRKTAEYNHFTMYQRDVETQSESIVMEATYVYNMWESDYDDYFVDSSIKVYIINEAFLNNIKKRMEEEWGFEASFYYDEQSKTYTYWYSSQLDRGAACGVLNESFYTIECTSSLYADYVSLRFNWSVIPISSNRVMNVAGRSFKGADIQQKDYLYYSAMKEVLESSTLEFDNYGACHLITTKKNSGNTVSTYYEELYGEYEQDPFGVHITFDRVKTNDGVSYFTIDKTLELSVNQDQLTMVSDVSSDGNGTYTTISLIYNFDKPLNGYVTAPHN